MIYTPHAPVDLTAYWCCCHSGCLSTILHGWSIPGLRLSGRFPHQWQIMRNFPIGLWVMLLVCMYHQEDGRLQQIWQVVWKAVKPKLMDQVSSHSKRLYIVNLCKSETAQKTEWAKCQTDLTQVQTLWSLFVGLPSSLETLLLTMADLLS